MLKADLIKVRLEQRGAYVRVKHVAADYHYLGLAGDLIRLITQHRGKRRKDWTEAVRRYEGDSLEYNIIRGLAAVLEARCTFHNEPPVAPAELRAYLFAGGPVTTQPDLFTPQTRAQRIADAAQHYNLTPAAIDSALFADLAEEQILVDIGGSISPGEVIARYNLELARGVLYWAREVRITVYDNYKDLFKYIKLFKLMYTIVPLKEEDGYHVTLYGPISPFVQSTIRYGLQFAKFMPALLLGERWRMVAEVQPSGAKGPGQYLLDHQTDLQTHFRGSPLFDSKLEANFAAEFEAKFGGAERKWELTREDELIIVGDTVMIPDFALTHRTEGRRALVELVGFWHPQYLRRKIEKVRAAKRTDLILLVYEDINLTEDSFDEASAGEVLYFKRKPVLKDVLAAAERCAI